MVTDPSGTMELHFIQEYLHARGCTPESIRAMPDAIGRRLLADAAEHASLRLTEIEARARFVESIHGRPGDV
jgi:hypothetical protein